MPETVPPNISSGLSNGSSGPGSDSERSQGDDLESENGNETAAGAVRSVLRMFKASAKLSIGAKPIKREQLKTTTKALETLSDLFEAKVIFQRQRDKGDGKTTGGSAISTSADTHAKEEGANDATATSKSHSNTTTSSSTSSSSSSSNDKSPRLKSVTHRIADLIKSNRVRIALAQSTIFEIIKNSILGSVLFSAYEATGKAFDTTSISFLAGVGSISNTSNNNNNSNSTVKIDGSESIIKIGQFSFSLPFSLPFPFPFQSSWISSSAYLFSPYAAGALAGAVHGFCLYGFDVIKAATTHVGLVIKERVPAIITAQVGVPLSSGAIPDTTNTTTSSIIRYYEKVVYKYPVIPPSNPLTAGSASASTKTSLMASIPRSLRGTMVSNSLTHGALFGFYELGKFAFCKFYFDRPYDRNSNFIDEKRSGNSLASYWIAIFLCGLVSGGVSELTSFYTVRFEDKTYYDNISNKPSTMNPAANNFSVGNAYSKNVTAPNKTRWADIISHIRRSTSAKDLLLLSLPSAVGFLSYEIALDYFE